MVSLNKHVNESYSITIISKTNAKKKPVSFVLSQKYIRFLLIAFVMIILAFLVITLSFNIIKQKLNNDLTALSSKYSTLESAYNKVSSDTGYAIDEKDDIYISSGANFLIDNTKKDNKIDNKETATTNGQTATTYKGKVELLDWFKGGAELFERNSEATVIDVKTGLSFKVRRHGGIYHADVEPVTKNDTATMKKIYGGSWSWDRRAIILVVDGRYIATSMNGMPHAGESIGNNNFGGHFCIHFKNSKIHATGLICQIHQACIQYAYKNGNK